MARQTGSKAVIHPSLSLNSNLRILNSIFNSLKRKKERKKGRDGAKGSKGKQREAKGSRGKHGSWKVGKLGIYKLSKQSLNSNLRILNSICNSRGKKV